ncbi:MAG TPA: SRPBCC family protein [Solirubrobacteraceae bacterium]|nr:SRPBCC family protein [Solirubrobacteraceae bacterium]
MTARVRTTVLARLAGMKRLHGAAEATVDVPIEGCLSFLADLEAYPSWYPEVVREVQVVEYGDDGLPLKAETKLHLSYGPVSRDLDLLLAITVRSSGLVQLTHIPRGPSSGASFDAIWRLEDHAGTQLELELDATMPVPGVVPLGGVGDAFAAGFMQAAVTRLES